MDRLGGKSRIRGFEVLLSPICGGDIEEPLPPALEPLVDLPVDSEPEPGVGLDAVGVTRVVGRGGKGQAGRFMTIEGVNLKLCPGDGGDFMPMPMPIFDLIVLFPTVAVTVPGVAVADESDDNKADAS
jgi:hypothetical protein